MSNKREDARRARAAHGREICALQPSGPRSIRLRRRGRRRSQIRARRCLRALCARSFRSLNTLDKIRHGSVLKGERHPLAKLSNQEVLKVRTLRASGQTWREIAEAYGMSMSGVADAAKRAVENV